MKLRMMEITTRALLGLLVSCGPKQGLTVDASRNLGFGENGGTGDSVSVSLNAMNRDNPESSFSLASAGEGDFFLASAADAFQFSISNCISGYTLAGDETTTDIFVQDGDINCELKLSSLTVSGVVYDLSGISTWSTGDSFTVGSSPNQLLVIVVAQLPQTISSAAPPAVVISYGGLSSGSTGNVSPGVSASLSVSGDSIDLDLANADSTVEAGTGKGLFTFTLDCSENIASGACAGIDLASLDVGLANNSGAADPTLEQCKSIAQTAASKLNVGADGQLSSTTQQLAGPGQMFAPENSDLLLTVYDSASQSCKYFKIIVSL